jgi:hypothetical protein
VAVRAATSDMMDGSMAVLRASTCLLGEPLATLRDGASCYYRVPQTCYGRRVVIGRGTRRLVFLNVSTHKIVAPRTLF